jgi:Carboxypeptidase regulatory-like domain
MRVRHTPLLLLIGLSTAAEVLPSQKKPRAIGGRVLSVDGKPAVGARIILRWRAHPELPSLVGYTLGGGGVVEREFTSGEKGRFRIVPPNIGPFLLVGKAGGASSSQAFPVLPGDFRELRLEPDHIMGGVVLGRDGKPVADATVRLVGSDALQRIRIGLYRQPERRAETRTDVAGRFSLHFEHGYLRDPRWNTLMALQAEHEGVMTPTLAHQRPTGSSKNVTLRLGGRGRFDVKIIDASTGKPIAGVRILDPLAPDRKIVTDDKGRCRVPPIRGESLILIAERYRPTVIGVSPVEKASYGWSMHPGLTLRTTLTGPNGPLTGARILLSSPLGNAHPMEWHGVVSEEGKVELRSMPVGKSVLAFVEVEGRFVKFFEGVPPRAGSIPPIRVRPDVHVRGRVLTGTKMPIAGARVALQSLSGAKTNPHRVTYTDRAGRFRFEGVFPARHQIVAAKGEHGQSAVTIAATQLQTPITVTLQPESTIEGRVLRPDGKPAANAWVTIYRSATGPFIRGPRISMTCLSTMTNAQGHFRLGVAKKTSWSLVAAILHDGAHCNLSTTARAGAQNVILKTTIANR